VVIEYGPWTKIKRTKIINAAHIEIIEEDGKFQMKVLDVAGNEHMAYSDDELLENVYVDDENKYSKYVRI
jgi:hypothetical protein